MKTTLSSLATHLLLSSLGLAGCTADAPEVGEDTATEASPPAEPTFSAEGVTIAERTDEHVAGRFERDGAALTFDLSADRALGARRIVLRTIAGEHLYESTLDHGIDRSTYLGGRATSVGRFGEEPVKSGDLSVFDELPARPEASLMPQLKVSLEAAGVPGELLSSPSATEGGLGTRIYGAGGSTSFPDNRWYVMNAGTQVGFYSWGFWATTAIRLQGFDNYHAVFGRAGTSQWFWSGSGQQTYYGQWWGGYVSITNTAHLCAIGAPCDSRTWILVK